ncbi:MAG TPA: phospholipid carrier-dependent glycosyltransferase, partial [Clostridia bacterium]|nr:phospholipid carrier-dependent glycosyltransferase [Clostridia bacterium]
AWASKAAESFAKLNPASFYTTPGFSDYPPGYMYVLAVVGFLREIFNVAYDTAADWFIVKLPAIIADLLIMVFAYRIAEKKLKNIRIGLVLAALVAISPMFIVDSASWGQIDSVLSLFIILSIYKFSDKKFISSFVFYVLAILIKPQALVIAPAYLFMTIGVLINKNNIKEMPGFILSLLLPIFTFLFGLVLLILAGNVSSLALFWITIFELIIAGLLTSGYYIVKSMEKSKYIKEDLPRAMIAISVAMLVFVGAVIPFSIGQKPTWIADKYFSTMGQYPYATLSAFNLHAIVGRNLYPGEPIYGSDSNAPPVKTSGPGFHMVRTSGQWKDMNTIALGYGMTYATLGYILMGLLFAYLLLLCIKNRDPRMMGPYCALLIAGVFMFATQMHERYLFPVVPVLLASYLIVKDRRLINTMIAFSVTSFINIALVLFIHFEPSNYISGDNMLLRLISVINIIIFVYLAVIIWDIAVNKRIKTYEDKYSEETLKAKAANLLAPIMSGKTVFPKLEKKDYINMLVITVIYAAISFVNLGTTVTPQTYWSPTQTQTEAKIELKREAQIGSFLVHHNLGEGRYTIEASEDGAIWTEVINYTASYSGGIEIFKWKRLNTSTNMYAKYIKVKVGRLGFRVNEIIPYDITGQQIELASVEVLGPSQEENSVQNAFDEQHTAPELISHLNGMYFDEIYHARTAYEYNNAWRVYETTHPPLGKVIMSWGITLFGMSPFGWRFMGNIFGILMIPLMYLFGKLLFKDRRIAAALALLMAFDGMHFVQTRIATIDVYGVFFIILMYYFMYKYYLMNFYRDGLLHTLVPLGLSGIAFGLGCASKWIGLYAGLGLAIIFFMSLYEKFEQYRAAKLQLKQKAYKDNPVLKNVVRNFPQYAAGTVLFCTIAFIAVPIVIYCLSYIPYLRSPGIGSWSQRILDNQTSMFNYHSSLFNDKHDFRSQWIEWPLMLRPMWYYNMGDLSANLRSTIACFGNPIIWIGGLICSIISSKVFFKARNRLSTVELKEPELQDVVKDRKTLSFMFIGLLANFLPWILVSRSTFIYHYFASLPFIMILTAFMLNIIIKKPKGATIVRNALIITGILSVIFYPAWSGLIVPAWFIGALRWLPTWYF